MNWYEHLNMLRSGHICDWYFNFQLLGPVVVSILQEAMNGCPSSVTEITPGLLLKDAAYGAAAYVYYELSNILSFKDWCVFLCRLLCVVFIIFFSFRAPPISRACPFFLLHFCCRWFVRYNFDCDLYVGCAAMILFLQFFNDLLLLVVLLFVTIFFCLLLLLYFIILILICLLLFVGARVLLLNLREGEWNLLLVYMPHALYY